MKKRKATEVVRGAHQIDGAGVHLRRVLGPHSIGDFDPFLMLDGFDSKNPNDYIKGFPWHPHRGIETITYLVSGSMEHQDSLGNKGLISSMGCQWMTAGSGIVHQEMPLASERMLGCQLWVNLPRKDKMAPPTYRGLSGEDIPVVEEETATVRVLSGNYGSVKGALQGSYSQVTYLDVTLPANSTWRYTGSSNKETVFIYLLDGTVWPNEDSPKEEDKSCAILYKASDPTAKENEMVEIKAGAEGARFVLLSAEPLREPVAWGGPIVMNTNDELKEAFDQLDNGTFIRK